MRTTIFVCALASASMIFVEASAGKSIEPILWSICLLLMLVSAVLWHINETLKAIRDLTSTKSHETP